MLIARLVIDFGMVVLIWLVQLVVYPGFTFYAEKDLIAWHKKYTQQVSIVVMPLMLSQAALIGINCYQKPDFLNISSILFLLLTWYVTFFIAVPLHNSIDNGGDIKEKSHRLVFINWWRTIAWSILFIISALQFMLR